MCRRQGHERLPANSEVIPDRQTGDTSAGSPASQIEKNSIGCLMVCFRSFDSYIPAEKYTKKPKILSNTSLRNWMRPGVRQSAGVAISVTETWGRNLPSRAFWISEWTVDTAATGTGS